MLFESTRAFFIIKSKPQYQFFICKVNYLKFDSSFPKPLRLYESSQKTAKGILKHIWDFFGAFICTGAKYSLKYPKINPVAFWKSVGIIFVGIRCSKPNYLLKCLKNHAVQFWIYLDNNFEISQKGNKNLWIWSEIFFLTSAIRETNRTWNVLRKL